MAQNPHAGLPALMPRLVAFARTIVGNAETARDLVQEAAARAVAARRVPDEPRAYCAWLFRIVRNAAIDELRRSRLPAGAEPAEPEVDIWNFDNAAIARITVEQGLMSLAPAHRDIIALIDIAGFGYAEAGDILNVPVGTVMSRIARARAALLAAIEASSVRPLKSSHGH
jgi:RNA polymerase sigma-70 factor (ECF subfamily)